MHFFGGKLQSGWQMGVVEEIIKESISNPQNKYVLYIDAQVRSIWVENFNTLLDDSKVLSLPSGNRLRLNHGNFRVIIETPDLHMASPATITRCSIVYIPSEIVTLDMTIKKSLSMCNFPSDLVKPLEELLQQLTKEQVRSVMHMLPALLPEYLLTKDDGWMYSEILGVQRIVVYLIGLLGCYENIKKLLIKELTPLKLPLSKYYVSFEKYPEGEYVLLDQAQEVPPEIKSSELFVPNISARLCRHFIEKSVNARRNLIIRGSQGSGKTESIKWALNSMPSFSRGTLHTTKFLRPAEISSLL